ncbi:MAG: hypothetical protein ACREPE_00775, partial [Lysobacter sp.]
AQTRGSRFMRFCESRLDVPRFLDGLHVEWSHGFGRGKAIGEHAGELHEIGDINFLERGILESRAMRERCAHAHWRLGVLQMKWTTVLGEDVALQRSLKPIGLGIALAVSAHRNYLADELPIDSLVMMRVQDHVRRLGLGAEFMQRIITGCPDLTGVNVRPGHYGPNIGELTAPVAKRQSDRLGQMFAEARLRRGMTPGG